MTNNRFYGMIGGLAIAASALAFSATAATAFDGFGQDIPLESAARQIVPDGWSVDFGDGVDKAAAVSWSTAKDWKSALSAAVAKKGYVAQYGSRSVVIAKGGRVAQAPDAAPRADKPAPRADRKVETRKAAQKPPAKAVEKADPVRVHGGGGFVMVPVKEKAPAVAEGEKGDWKPYAGKATKDGKDVAAKPKGFAVAEGDNLRSVLDVWGQSVGWKVIWKSEFTYPIAAAATFEGDFIEATTALLKAMKDSRPAINADFFRGNKVVVISNSTADEAN